MLRSLMRGLLPRPAGQSQLPPRPPCRPPVEALENRTLLTATFQGLGQLPGGELSNSSADAVSADGSTVVGTSSSDRSDLEAFRWTAATGMVGLGFLPGGDRSFAR